MQKIFLPEITAHGTPENSYRRKKTYEYDGCLEAFIQKVEHILYTRTHPGEKPHDCNECQKTFITKPHLVKHERTHTDEKPYGCKECGRTFSQV